MKIKLQISCDVPSTAKIGTISSFYALRVAGKIGHVVRSASQRGSVFRGFGRFGLRVAPENGHRAHSEPQRGIFYLFAEAAEDGGEGFVVFELDVAGGLFGPEILEVDQEAGVVDIGEFVVDTRAEYFHGGREVHVRIDERRNVDAVFVHLGLEYFVVFLKRRMME